MQKVKQLAILLGFMVCLKSVIVQATHTSALKKLLTPDKIRYFNDHESRPHRHRHSTFSTQSSQDSPKECCPSIRRTITPLGGISRDGALLKLYRTEDTVQKFHEVTCARNVESKPCNFIDRSEWTTVCEQETSYTYAIAKSFGKAEDFRIDYIKILSGCSCKIVGPTSPKAISQQSEILPGAEKYGVSTKKLSSDNKI